MKRCIAQAFIVAAVSLVVVSAAHAQKGKMPTTFTPAADMKWDDVPNFPGIKMAVVKGDPAKGPSQFFLKFPGGFKAPVHHHTSDHSGVLLAGTLTLTTDEKDTKLPAGSHIEMTKKAKHATTCEPGADCVLYLDVRGKWDVIAPEEKGAAGEKKGAGKK